MSTNNILLDLTKFYVGYYCQSVLIILLIILLADLADQ